MKRYWRIFALGLIVLVAVSCVPRGVHTFDRDDTVKLWQTRSITGCYEAKQQNSATKLRLHTYGVPYRAFGTGYVNCEGDALRLVPKGFAINAALIVIAAGVVLSIRRKKAQ
jgi:hypothetical protein